MDIYNSNIQTIVNCIKKGSKGSPTDSVGVEIEHFVTYKDSGLCVPYMDGVENIMKDIAPYFDERFYSEGFLIGLSKNSYHITLEPGAQIEISIKPLERICDVERIYGEFISMITPVLEKYGCRLETFGCLPRGSAKNVTLIPKSRYKYMDEYFKTSGTLGINMMRASASTQVSIDFADERDMIKKFRTANILSPIFSLMCDNSPVFEGKPFCANAARAYIWSNVDDDRCKIVPSALDADFSFEKYAEYIYNSPAILVLNGDKVKFTDRMKIRDIYKDTLISDADAEHLLSMFFPDVRLKQYIEIRPADSMPIKYVASYAALIKGIFSSGKNFDFDITVSDIEKAREAVILKGFNADIYGMKAYEIAELIYETAENALSEGEKTYLLPLRDIIFNKQTLKETVNLAEG